MPTRCWTPILLPSRTLVIALAIVTALSGSHPSEAIEPGAGASATPLAQWPSYNNDYKARRFSALTQINPRNVRELREVCRVKVADSGSLHTGPVMIDGTLYVTTPLDTYALDATNCKVRWKYSYRPEQAQVYPGNRGVAVMNGRVFRGTADGRLLALDAATGRLIWKDVVGDPTLNEFIVGAPLAFQHPKPPMPTLYPSPLGEKAIRAIAAYIRTL